MKINVNSVKTKKRKAHIEPLRTPRTLEDELENFLLFMQKTINRRFENQVLKKLDRKTVKKFEDANYGNYANIYKKLVAKFKKSIFSQFDEKRILNYIKKLFKKNARMNDKTFYKNLEKGVGVDVKSIIKTDGTNSFINAKSLETSLMINKMLNETMGNLTQNTLRLMSAGKSLDTLYEEVRSDKKKNLNKAKVVARNELKAFNQQLSEKKAKNVGIKRAIWNTIEDARTRPCHAKRDGIEYDIEKGLYSPCDGKTLKPGDEINCRCYATYVVNFDEE